MIVVTGGAGFIGSHLVKLLVDRGAKVIVVDDFSTGSRENLEYLGVGNVEVREIDLTNFTDTKKALEGAYIVFHMAARVGGIPYLHGNENIELLSMQTNIAIDANVFRACQESGIKKIIYPSSVSVYPLARQQYPGAVFSEAAFVWPQHFDHVSPFRMSIDPDGGYGLAKILGEIQLHMMHGSASSPQAGGKVKVGIARIFSAYGENEPLSDNSHVLSRLMQSAVRGAQMVIWGDGTQTRDYVYVSDCAAALIKIADHLEEFQASAPFIVNIGSGRGVSVNELAKKIITLSGKDIKLIYDKEKPVGPVSRTADIMRAIGTLGWEPKVSLEEGLERTYGWIKTKMGI